MFKGTVLDKERILEIVNYERFVKFAFDTKVKANVWKTRKRWSMGETEVLQDQEILNWKRFMACYTVHNSDFNILSF